MPAKTLSVFPNPYLSFDDEGRPVHHLAVDGTSRAFVGAHLVATVHAKDLKGFATDQRTWFEYDLETPSEVPNTHYYAQALRSGDILAADEKTARAVGLKFEEPKAKLEASKAALSKRWADHYPDEDTPEMPVHAIGTHAEKLAAAKTNKPAAAATQAPVIEAPKAEPDAPRDLTPATAADLTSKPGLVALSTLQPDPAAKATLKGDA